MKLKKFIERLEKEREKYIKEFNKEPSISDFSNDFYEEKLEISLHSKKQEMVTLRFMMERKLFLLNIKFRFKKLNKSEKDLS